MARKPQHFTDGTACEIHEMFVSAFGSVGMRLSGAEREERLNAVVMDGIPFAERPAELRKPGSSFSATSYLEARTTAGLLVDLELACDVANVVRSDGPDVEVCFRDGGVLYVEQTMVLDEAAHRLSVAVDDANIAAYEASLRDEGLRALFAGGIFGIRLNDLTELDRAFPVRTLAAEIIGLARTITGEVSLCTLDAERFPLLHSLGAAAVYRPSSAQTVRPIYLPVFHARSEKLEPALRQSLEKKLRKAERYPEHCKPLWLLLDVDTHFDAGRALDAIARRVIADVFKNSTPASPYERIVLQQVKQHPIVFVRRQPAVAATDIHGEPA